MSGARSDPGTPNHGRFRKGQSGNPGGRPRKRQADAASAFNIVVERTLSVTRKGVPQEITMEEALQHRTYQDAIAGKRMAQRQVLKWIEKREAWLSKHAPQAPVTPIQVLHFHDPENADEAMVLLGIAAENLARAGPGMKGLQLLLEPWAVQAALDRRRGRQALEQKEVNEIKRCTREPDRLRWPRGSAA